MSFFFKIFILSITKLIDKMGITIFVGAAGTTLHIFLISTPTSVASITRNTTKSVT